jgi:hypothetical protein
VSARDWVKWIVLISLVVGAIVFVALNSHVVTK